MLPSMGGRQMDAATNDPGNWREAPFLIAESVERCLKFTRIPGVTTPYTGISLVWQGQRYCVVKGVDNTGRERLIEVFRVDASGELHAVPAFRYPLPLCDMFPLDFEAFYDVDPWGGPVAELTVSEIANGARMLIATSPHLDD